MKADEQYLYVVHVLLLLFLCFTKPFYILILRMKPKMGAIEVKAIEQYLHVILFVILHKMILTYNRRLKPWQVTQ